MFKRPRCPKCSRQAGIQQGATVRNTNGLKELERWLKDKPIKLRPGSFLSRSEHAEFKCTIDGHRWKTSPKVLMSMKYGCKVCSQKASGAEQFQATWADTVAQMKTRGVALLGQPKSSDDVVRYRCPKHNCWVENTVKTVRGRLHRSPGPVTGCLKCAQASFNKTSYKRLPFKRGPNDTVHLMGYEPLAVSWLSEKGIPLSSLVVSTDPDFTVIEYKDRSGKRRKYIPDFFIKDTRICIEVKSLYTAGIAQNMSSRATGMGTTQQTLFDTLVRKRNAAVEKGFDFHLMVFGGLGKITLPKTWYTMSRDDLKTWIMQCKKNVDIL